MDRRSASRTFAIVSIAAGGLHFIGETWWHVLFDQFLPMLIVDYIAVALLIVSGIIFLRSGRSFGLLCGAWGFSFCLGYRAFFWRLEVILAGGHGEGMLLWTMVLGATLGFAALMFLLSLYLTYESA